MYRPPGPPAIAAFKATPFLITPADSSTLTWSVLSSRANVTLDGAAVPMAGSRVVSPVQTTTYSLQATNDLGGAAAKATVTVDAGTAALDEPAVVAPAAGQVIGVSGTTFSWGGVGGAAGYDLRVWDASSGMVAFAGSLSGGASTSTLIALPEGSYLFGVRRARL